MGSSAKLSHIIHKRVFIQHVSDELIVSRIGNGIRLMKANPYKTGQTVSSLMKLPLNVYFVDTDCSLVKLNEDVAELCDFDSPNSAIGKTAFDFANKKSAEFAQFSDKKVMRQNAIGLFEHELALIDGDNYREFTVKAPWYDDNNKIIGVVGFSTAIGKHSLVNSIIELKKLGLLDYQAEQNESELFTKREMDYLPLLMRGKTAKEISALLNISPRTAEGAIANIKVKIGASSKSSLIEMLHTYFSK